MRQKNKITATIITIGDELLIGQVIDTNSVFIAQQLNKIGVWVSHKIAIGDNAADIKKALQIAENNSDIVIITGGLGPTADDITKPLLTQHFGGKLIINVNVLKHIKQLFQQKGLPLIESNYKQAEVPDNCEVLTNIHGTAPGMLFRKRGQLFFSLPGVPFEMKDLMTKQVIPIIQSSFVCPYIIHQTLIVMGIGESFLAEQLYTFEQTLPAYIKLAYLPSPQMIRLRLTATGSDKNTLDSAIKQYYLILKEHLAPYIVAEEDITLDKKIIDYLQNTQSTLSTAESCTGGSIAALFTSTAGSSAYFLGSVVAYNNSIKEKILQVRKEDLITHGAVSQPVVEQMAMQILQITQSDYAIATSGILGPSGGTKEKPVGTVWIAVADKKQVISKIFHFNYKREQNKEATIKQALNMLNALIENN